MSYLSVRMNMIEDSSKATSDIKRMIEAIRLNRKDQAAWLALADAAEEAGIETYDFRCRIDEYFN